MGGVWWVVMVLGRTGGWIGAGGSRAVWVLVAELEERRARFGRTGGLRVSGS